MFVFYTSGGGARGAVFSIGVSLGLMVINKVPPNVLAVTAVVVAVLATLVWREAFATAWSRLLRFIQSEGEARPGTSTHLDAVLARLRTMPTEKWKPAKELSIRDLRQRVRSTENFLERSELEKAYAEAFNDVCPICAEAWAPGDVYRRLERCGHHFHIECIDRWAMTSADKGRTPLCPLCKSTF
uniref:RING-type domain-containing protein n=1 Tax=Chrysocystis fragilis TaxID=1411660 RepID=A0A7S0XLU8_9STRA|mmetsp:Transcript_305/g.911  ORF Transcript_305/g.911 Transcript_305/m.911 type:complete len:185 (+) Transcript_305:45-599(+)